VSDLRKLASMRSLSIVLIAAVLALAPPALAQDDPVSQAAGNLPSHLFEPAPDGVPARSAPADDGGASFLLAGLLVAVAAAAGYFTGSSRSTLRS
jgi:hypothetical protein